MSEFDWKATAEGYRAVVGSDDYVMDVWSADSGGWYVGVNDGTVIDPRNNDDKLFETLEDAKTAAELMAKELMREDGYSIEV